MAQREVSDEMDQWLRALSNSGSVIGRPHTTRYVADNPPPLQPPCWVTWGTSENTFLWVGTKQGGA